MDLIVNPENLNTNDLLFLDTQFVLGDPEGGYKLFLERHVPRAMFVDLDGVLCGPISERAGRHPLPDLKQFISFLEENAIGKEQRIVVYDNGGGGFAARLWWMLRTLGYPDVAVMNGGIDAWIDAGLPVEKGGATENRSRIKLDGLPETWEGGYYPIVGSQELKTGIERGIIVPIDSRNRERYLGLEKGPDFLAGRIPAALNLPWGEHLEKDKKLLPREILEKRFGEILSNKSIFYCGSGVTACFNVLLAEWLGFGKIPLYPGSWSEWIRIFPDFIEKG